MNARGIKVIESHVAEAHRVMAKREYEKAEANLTAGAEIAAALGLFARPAEDARAQLRTASRGKFGGPVTTGTRPNPDPVAASPVKPIAGTTGTMPTTGGLTGRQMLDQAVIEFKSGNLDMAAKLAQQAHNMGGVQDDARGVLNSIDAERFVQREITAARSFDAAETAYNNKEYSQAVDVKEPLDPNLIATAMQGKRDQLITAWRTELDKLGMSTTVASGSQPQPLPGGMSGTGGIGEPPVLRARHAGLGSDPKSPDSVATQPTRQSQVQKLRSDSLKIRPTPGSLRSPKRTSRCRCSSLRNRVRSSNLDAASVAQFSARSRPARNVPRDEGQTDAIARVTANRGSQGHHRRSRRPKSAQDRSGEPRSQVPQPGQGPELRGGRKGRDAGQATRPG